MKTIELKWIEDEDQTVAQDAFVGLQELIDDGVFPDLTVKEEDGYLYLTGEKDVLDKVVMKLQKDYAKYGQIMIKESKKDAEATRVESYDDNLQDIFNHTVKEFEDVKKNVKSENYITNLGKYEMRFKKLKEAAKGKDKSLIQNYIDEIATLTEGAEIKKIKPFKKFNEGFDFKTQITPLEMYNTVIELNTKMKMNFDISKTFNSIIVDTNPIKFYIKANERFLWVKQGDTNVYRQKLDNGLLTKSDLVDVMSWIKECIRDYKVTDESVYEMPENNESFKAKFNAAVMEQLSDLKNWGIVEETPEPEMNESFLSPKELKKKLQRVCTQWASIEGRTFTEVWDELRKKKSVKDMLDFYTVDEIIEDLRKKKKEADDELEDEDKIK